MSIGHDQLALKLAAHLAQNTDRMIWTDMQLGPSGSARPDVYTLNKSYVRPMPISYECKISKADFMSDATSGKWQKYLEFSCGVIFCAPKGLLTKDDVPAGCGLITYNEETGAFFTAKGPILRTAKLPEEVMLKLLIDGVKRIHTARRDESRTVYSLTQTIKAKVGKDVNEFLSNKSNAEVQLASLMGEISRCREQLEEIRADSSAITEKAREVGQKQALAKMEEAEATWTALYELLKLRPGAGQWEARAALNAIRSELTANKEVKRLAEVINSIGHEITRAAKHPAGTIESVDVGLAS